MFVVLIPLFAFREVARAVGEQEFTSLMLGRETPGKSVASEEKGKGTGKRTAQPFLYADTGWKQPVELSGRITRRKHE